MREQSFNISSHEQLTQLADELGNELDAGNHLDVRVVVKETWWERGEPRPFTMPNYRAEVSSDLRGITPPRSTPTVDEILRRIRSEQE